MKFKQRVQIAPTAPAAKWIKGLTLFALVLGAATRANAADSPAMPKEIQFGAAWYPEQWPEHRWAEDLRLMQQAGMNVVRVAEFAWSKLEPREGQFDFAWLDRAIDLASQFGIATVIGTPTASPPAWLTQKYPDVLRTSSSGQRELHGNRAHGSFSSPRYRILSRKIAAAMAKHFGSNPHIIGWQIDNEYSLISMGPDTRKQWQEWLRKQHGTLASLNDRWTTAYWSQTYFRWDQIPLSASGNPGLALDFKRFVTATWADYQRNQVDVVRALTKAPITTNYMVAFDGFDHHVTAADLNVASVDYYVASARVSPTSGQFLDVVRGLLKKNFWVMETQIGRVDFAEINSGHQPGETRTQTWQSIGHGADLIGYWQWRSGLNGQEQYYGTALGPDGAPRPVYEEVARTGHEIRKASAELIGTTPVSDVAMLYSWPSRWSVNGQRHHKAFEYGKLWSVFYSGFRAQLTSIDAVSPEADLSQYKVIVAPALHVQTAAATAGLIKWIGEGGHLVLGPRSGVKDEHNRLLSQRQPGAFADLLGGVVDDFYPLDEPVAVKGTLGSGQAEIWGERLAVRASGVTTLLTYGSSQGWLANQPAALSRAVGKGRITYIGFWPDPPLMERIATWALANRYDSRGFTNIPKDVEISQRHALNRDIFVIINHNGTETRRITLPAPMLNLFTGATTKLDIQVAPRDVVVLKRAL